MGFNRIDNQLFREVNIKLDKAHVELKEENKRDRTLLNKLKVLEAKAIANSKKCQSIAESINLEGSRLIKIKATIENKIQSAINQTNNFLYTNTQYNESNINSEIENLLGSYSKYLEELNETVEEYSLPSFDEASKVNKELENEIQFMKSTTKLDIGLGCINEISSMITISVNLINEMQPLLNNIQALLTKIVAGQTIFKEQTYLFVKLLNDKLIKLAKKQDEIEDGDDDVQFSQNPLYGTVINRTPSQPIPRIPSKTQTPESKISSDSGSDSSPSEEKRNPAVRRNLMATNSLFAAKKVSAVVNDTNNNVCETKNDSTFEGDSRYKAKQTPNMFKKGYSLQVNELDPNLTEDQKRRLAIDLVEKYIAGNPKDTPKVTGKDIMVLYIKAYMDAMQKLAKHKDDKDKYDRKDKEFSPENRKPVEAEVKKMIKFLEKNKVEFLSKLKEPQKAQCCIM